MEEQKEFAYWKRSYQKWVVLAAGALQFACLLLNLQEFYEIEAAGIFGADAWKKYAAEQGLQCALNGMVGAIFLGIFAIGSWAKDFRSARLAEGVLLLCLTLIWGAAGIVIPLGESAIVKIMWLAFLFLGIGGSVFSFWQRKRYTY